MTTVGVEPHATVSLLPPVIRTVVKQVNLKSAPL